MSLNWNDIGTSCRGAMAPIYELVRAEVKRAALDGLTDVDIPRSSFNAIIPMFFDKLAYRALLRDFCIKEKIEFVDSCRWLDEKKVRFQWEIANLGVHWTRQ